MITKEQEDVLFERVDEAIDELQGAVAYLASWMESGQSLPEAVRKQVLADSFEKASLIRAAINGRRLGRQEESS